MKKRPLVLAICFGVMTLAAMAASKTPIFVSPNFKPELVDQVSVFVVDPKNDVENNKECIGGAEYGTLSSGGAEPSLAKRGYGRHGRASLTRFYSATAVPTEALLANPTKEWLQELSNQKYLDPKGKDVLPPGRWIMFITIDELGSRENVVKGLGRATLSMYLYDRDEGTLLWHDQATREHVWNGLMGNVMSKGDAKRDACATLVFQMVMKMPKHKK